jgi:hypothetical protein
MNNLFFDISLTIYLCLIYFSPSGYLPMEFLHGNIVSRKLDIFSLGVIMIKIIAGHGSHSRSVEMSHKEFHDLVRNLTSSPYGQHCAFVCRELAVVTQQRIS